MNKILKVSTTAFALFASLAICAAAIAVAAPNSDKNDDKKLVKTRLSIAYDPGSSNPYDEDYNEAKFSGRAKTKKICRGGRKVKITDVGKTTTDRKGRYVIAAGTGAAPGTYQASIKKRVITKKNGKKVICKKAKSPKVTVD